MKRTMMTLAIASICALGGVAGLQAGEHGGRAGHRGMHDGMGGGHRGNPLAHLTKELDLTPEQQAAVSPIVKQTKPQLQAIHQEAMQRARAVMDSAEAQIRPLLKPEQQQKLDALKKAHDEMRNARRAMRDARRS